MIRPLATARTPGLALYRAPGTARFATIAMAGLPPLAPVLKSSRDETGAIVVDKRGEWLLIVYDDAGRTGWVRMERSWDFHSWKDYLPGKTLKMLPGLRKNFYTLSGRPADNAPAIAVTQAGKPFRAGDVDDDWCEIDGPGTGWVRWRDGDGRLLIAVDDGNAAQNR